MTYLALYNPHEKLLTEKMLILHISRQFLTGPVFEKKIIAMKNFSEVIDELANGVSHANNLEKVAVWLKTERVLESIFIDCPAAAIIKRATNLIVLREYYKNCLDETMIKGIWHCCVQPDREIRYETLTILMQLVD